MHKNQINYLYSSFMFVLITVYSFSSLTAEAGSMPLAAYSKYKTGFNFNTKINNCNLNYFLDNNVKKSQFIYNECEHNQLQSNRHPGKFYIEDLLLCANEQKNNTPVKKNKNPFPHLLKLTDRPIKQDGKNR